MGKKIGWFDMESPGDRLGSAIADWRTNHLARILSHEEQDKILALAERLRTCSAVEEMPTAEEIEKMIKQKK